MRWGDEKSKGGEMMPDEKRQQKKLRYAEIIREDDPARAAIVFKWVKKKLFHLDLKQRRIYINSKVPVRVVTISKFDLVVHSYSFCHKCLMNTGQIYWLNSGLWYKNQGECPNCYEWQERGL